MPSPTVCIKATLPLLLIGMLHAPLHAQTQTTTTRYEYDAVGNVTKVTDALGQVTTQQYDALNRLIKQTQPSPATGAATPIIGLSYDGLDQLKTVTDPRTLSTNYTVTGLGDTTAQVSPDTGNTTNTYDAAGNVRTSTDARGKVTTYSYDRLNRLTYIAYPTGTATAYEYDGGTTGAANAKGRLTKVTDEAAVTRYTYNGFGRIVTKTQTVYTGSVASDMKISYAYGTTGSANGKLTSITYSSGNRINYSYNAAGRISTITLNPVNSNGVGTNTGTTVPLLANIVYHPFGQPISWTWGNGATYSRTIDLDGRITRFPLGMSNANGTVRSITYDSDSRLTSTTHTGSGTGSNLPANFNQSYGYDHLDRLTTLTSPTTPSNNQAYQYDATGNRTQATFGSTTYTNTIAATSNKLTSTTGPTPAKTNTYDAAGNLISDGKNTYTYSDRGRLKSVSTAVPASTSNTYTYTYNGLGQRINRTGPSSVVPTGTNHYTYDEAGHLLGEYNGTYVPLQETIYLGDMPVVVLKQTRTVSGTTTTVTTDRYYVFTDQINTPRVITRRLDNQMVWRWDNADAFGLTPVNENPNALGAFNYNPRFPGQLFDKETNNHYNYFRDYDPQLGRYIQSDPIGLLGGMNTFAYVNNQPTRFVDPLGLWSFSFGGYLGPGWEVSFGKDPITGQGFISGRIGLGYGAGINFDPNGGRPGSNDWCKNKGKGAGGTMGMYAGGSGGVGVGGMGVSGNISGARGRDFGTGKNYSDPSASYSYGYEPGGKTGIGASLAFGIEVSIYDNGKNACLCQ